MRSLRQDVDEILYALNRKDSVVGTYPVLDGIQALENTVAELERSVTSLPK